MVKEKLIQSWMKSGLSQGDCVLLHSNTLRTMLRDPKIITPQLILDTFLDTVGPTGTMLFPLYNFGFSKGVPFDIRNTPSKMGALTEAARLHPGAVRTGHPMFSFAVIGRHAHKFMGVNNFTGYGKDSPCAMLRELDGKIAVLDLEENESMSFYHHVEEMNEVEYRYHKIFTGEYTDVLGNTSQQSYGHYVRDLERGVVCNSNPGGELLWDAALYTGDRPMMDSGLRVISARKIYDFISEILVSGRAKGLLYKEKGEDSYGR